MHSARDIETAQIWDPETNQVTGCRKEEYDNNSKIKWLLDNECTEHIIKSNTCFFNYVN